MGMSFQNRVRHSCLWAAYGDALGFMTELARESIVRQRTGHERVDGLSPWVRRIGGKFGVDVPLPAGCYSDDTQLRLATSRAIRGNGEFDVEAFASIELPVWGAYALGGGFASKEGAEALARHGAKWCTNFFSDKKARYIEGGGNGAAMRIQPHVWVAPKEAPSDVMLRDVIRNAITTHGHPRGFVGAAFHALCLRETLYTGNLPGPEQMSALACSLGPLSDIIRSDRDLEGFWLPLWEEQRRASLTESIDVTVQELLKDIDVVARILRSNFSATPIMYRRLVEELGCFEKANLGSATKTSLIAGSLAWWTRGNPYDCAVIAANALGSDTDTIATMACAIAGCVSELPPPQQTMDWDYLVADADRLAKISERQSGATFRYPDLLYWRAPRRPMDFVGTKNGKWFLAGLGEIHKCPHVNAPVTSGEFVWEWFELPFGQKVLLKHRKEPFGIADEMIPLFGNGQHMSSGENRRPATHTHTSRPAKPVTHNAIALSVNQAADDVIRSSFDPKLIGSWLLQFADEADGVDKAVAFSAITAKARNARTKRNGNGG
jgi:ADP-ribosylglycohydrolase